MINFFHKAYSTSASMVVAMPGKGSQYLLGLRDTDGDFLAGGQTYRLHIPANVPAANYWSVVLYDADTRSLLDNGQPFPSIASNSNLKPNTDDSAPSGHGRNSAAAFTGANRVAIVHPTLHSGDTCPQCG